MSEEIKNMLNEKDMEITGSIEEFNESEEKKIVEYYIRDKIFYATNEVGEIMRNYLMWCKKEQ